MTLPPLSLGKSRFWTLVVLAASSLQLSLAESWSDFDLIQQRELLKGETVVWCTPLADSKRCITKTAMILAGTPEQLFTIIKDKEAAVTYLDDVVSCRRISEDGDHELIEQRTRPPGVPKCFTYLLDFQNQYPVRMDFRRRSGDLTHIEGYWTFEAISEEQTLVSYALHIDPGKLVPKKLFCKQQAKRLPNVLTSVQRHLTTFSLDSVICLEAAETAPEVDAE